MPSAPAEPVDAQRLAGDRRSPHYTAASSQRSPGGSSRLDHAVLVPLQHSHGRFLMEHIRLVGQRGEPAVTSVIVPDQFFFRYEVPKEGR